MYKKKRRYGNDFGQLRTRIWIKTILLFVVAFIVIFLVYKLFLYQNFADPAVNFLNLFVQDSERAFFIYQRYVRTYLELYLLAAVIFVFIILLRFYLNNFVRYFNEINDGINSILDRSSTLVLSPELSAIEKKIIRIKLELEQKERASHEAEQRKDDLVMYLAHDIRTPLTSVIGYLSFLEEAPDMPAEQRTNYTRIALEKANRLEKMVDEFFEITRFNAQQTELQKKDIDITYMLMQLADELTPILDVNRNTIRIDAADNLIVHGDPEKLARAFNNVLKNAASYSTADTEIKISAQEAENGVKIVFQNEGETIPPEKLERLFDRFYRVDESRRTQTGGTGLGLAIAKEIVLLHGGTISAESQNNTVTFTIFIPGSEK